MSIHYPSVLPDAERERWQRDFVSASRQTGEIIGLESGKAGHFWPNQCCRVVSFPQAPEALARRMRLKITLFFCTACDARAPSLKKLEEAPCDQRHVIFTL